MEFSESSYFCEVALIINTVDSVFDVPRYLYWIKDTKLLNSWVFLLVFQIIDNFFITKLQVLNLFDELCLGIFGFFFELYFCISWCGILRDH